MNIVKIDLPLLGVLTRIKDNTRMKKCYVCQFIFIYVLEIF